MPTFDASQAECLVFTFKEGLLSKVAHDLKLRVQTFELVVEPGHIEASFDARSFEVVCAMRRGAENPGALSRDDCAQVLENMEREVLHPDRYPTIRFTSERISRQGRGWRVRGALDLHGVTQPLSGVVQPRQGALETRMRLNQPTWNIKPFRAMLGTLRIRPQVDVLVRVPLAELP